MAASTAVVADGDLSAAAATDGASPLPPTGGGLDGVVAEGSAAIYPTLSSMRMVSCFISPSAKVLYKIGIHAKVRFREIEGASTSRFGLNIVGKLRAAKITCEVSERR